MTKSCITIYTDASFCFQTKIGGWACWIKAAPGETALHSGAFKDDVETVDEAELKAMANGIAAAIRIFDIKEKIFVVVTDSQNAIKYIDLAKSECPPIKRTRNGKKKNRQYSERKFQIARRIRAMIPEGCELRVNKVKAHSNKDGARSYVNNVVDEACRMAMRKKRAAL